MARWIRLKGSFVWELIWSSWPLPCKEKEVEARTGRYQFYRHDITLPLVLALYSEGKHDATPLVKVWAVKTQDNKMCMSLCLGKVFFTNLVIWVSLEIRSLANVEIGWMYIFLVLMLILVDYLSQRGSKLRSHYTLIDFTKCTMSCHCVLKLFGCTTPVSA